MTYQLFQYPLPAPPELTDLNAFLDSHRIVSVSHHLVVASDGPMLIFLVQFVGRMTPSHGKSEARIDYRAVLEPEQFVRYSRLREERKAIATEVNAPVYTIFTNAQLAAMVQSDVRCVADLAALDGVGKGRIEKWGARMLKALEETR